MATLPILTRERLPNQPEHWIIQNGAEYAYTDSEVKARQFITKFLNPAVFQAAMQLYINHATIPAIEVNIWRGAEILARGELAIEKGNRGPRAKFAGKSKTWYAGIGERGLACNCPHNVKAPVIQLNNQQHRLCKHAVAYITYFKVYGGESHDH